MGEDLERLKQRIPLLEYLQRHNWTARRVGAQPEFVGLCPLHQETRPSFYVNARKNLFYCHGCGRGGDLIRFVELLLDLPFRQSVLESASIWRSIACANWELTNGPCTSRSASSIPNASCPSTKKFDKSWPASWPCERTLPRTASPDPRGCCYPGPLLVAPFTLRSVTHWPMLLSEPAAPVL